MSETLAALEAWGEELVQYRLPRWDELPEIELYMDQVITLVDRYLYIFHEDGDDTKILTAAMINNYVKMQVMPKPVKKRYHRRHLAYLIAITILKQTLSIHEIQAGIMIQCQIDGENGTYERFCQEQERAFQALAAVIRQNGEDVYQVPVDRTQEIPKASLGLCMATTAFACKMLTRKIISLKRQSLSIQGKKEG